MSFYDIKSVLDKYNFRFTKSLGQNFLIDDNVVKDIVEGAEITKDDFVIEIGPGFGTLTKEMLKCAKKVCAVEIDSKLIHILNEELKEFDNFSLINEDALNIDLDNIISNEENVKVVANLPYYLTTPLITRLFQKKYNIKSLTIMIQTEVADRINAVPNCKEYGSLTLLVQYYCKTKILRKVSRECFMPKPKVESSVIKLDKLDTSPVKVNNEELFFKIIRCSFGMRRKTLWNSLKGLGIDKNKMEQVFIDSKIDQKRRGETLSMDEFACLANHIDKIF